MGFFSSVSDTVSSGWDSVNQYVPGTPEFNENTLGKAADWAGDQFSGALGPKNVGSGNGQDYYYQRMANIAGRQQGMAEEMYNQYRYGQDTEPEDSDQGQFSQFDLEQQKLQANKELLPQLTGLQEQQIDLQTDLTEMRQDVLPHRQEAIKTFVDESLNGVDVQERVDQAGATAQREVGSAVDQMERQMGRRGLDPSDQNYMDSMEKGGLDLARTTTGARQQARQQAEDEQYQRLGRAAGLKV